MRKLIGGKYITVCTDPAPDLVEAKRASFHAVIDLADIEQMDYAQLLEFCQSAGMNANSNWRLETLRRKAYALIGREETAQ